MDSTYIIVLKDAGTGAESKYAIIKVLGFEPYISLILDCKLFNNYSELNQQMLEGSQTKYIEFERKQVVIDGADHDKLLNDPAHPMYIYKRVASAFNLTFSYKRKINMDGKNVRMQPIHCEMNTIKFSNTTPVVLASDSVATLTKEMLDAKKCDDICNCAYKLFFKMHPPSKAEPPLTPVSIDINRINAHIKSKFDGFNKSNLDTLEPKLIQLRDDALQSIPINMVNSAYRDLTNAGLFLCAKRDAYNEIKKIADAQISAKDISDATKAIPEALTEIQNAASQIASATFDIEGVSFNILTQLDSKYKSIVDNVIAKLQTETAKL
jgi:hypothetical protein